jgi:hypothetical protein
MNMLRNTNSLPTTTALQTNLQPSPSLGVMSELQTSVTQQRLSASGGTELIDRTIDRTTLDIIDGPIIVNPIFFDPGDTLGTARNWGTLNGTFQASQSVGDTDLADIYKISIGAGNLNASLTGMTADADLRLIRDINNNGSIDYGEILSSSTRGGSQDETINFAGLEAGDYYLQVSRYTGNTSYKLKASNTAPNNLLGVETDAGLLNGTKIYSGTISNSNTSDVYRFSVENTNYWFGSIPKNMNISLSGLTSDTDIRLVQDINNNGIVDSSDVLKGSYRGSTQAELITQVLSTGSYFLQVNQYSGTSNYHLGISTGDWFGDNLGDSEILGEARYAYNNGYGINREEMIALLRDAKDYGTIDATELTDLRKIVANAAGLGMPGYVSVLANKVVNSDPANDRSGIGNLFAGVGEGRMESLIGKWFLGSDRPTATGTYRYASGSLFQGGVSFRDVDQGAVGDCYFLASLGAVARQSPSEIQNMFIDNGDGTFTVRLFNNGTADYVTVDRYLPTYDWGNFVYANDSSGMAYNNVNNELWVALAEKAYAQANESGWLGQETAANSYASISGGWPFHAMKQITNRNTTHSGMTSNFLGIRLSDDVDEMWSAFASGKMVVLNTNGSPAGGIIGDHSYTLTGYNYVTGRYKLYNPWGGAGAEIELTHAQIADNFNTWDATV